MLKWFVAIRVLRERLAIDKSHLARIFPLDWGIGNLFLRAKIISLYKEHWPCAGQTLTLDFGTFYLPLIFCDLLSAHFNAVCLKMQCN